MAGVGGCPPPAPPHPLLPPPPLCCVTAQRTSIIPSGFHVKNKQSKQSPRLVDVGPRSVTEKGSRTPVCTRLFEIVQTLVVEQAVKPPVPV